MIIVRWSWSWLLELHIQVSHSSHCGIHHWWEMLRLLHRIQYPWNLWKHWNLCFSCSQGKNHGKHIAARRAKHMRGAYEIDDFMELCFLVFGRLFFVTRAPQLSLSGSFRIIRGLGIGVDPRRVQGEVPKRSGVQSHCRSLRCSVLQLSHNSFIAVPVCSCPLF